MGFRVDDEGSAINFALLYSSDGARKFWKNNFSKEPVILIDMWSHPAD
jgi:hypothetical protein